VNAQMQGPKTVIAQTTDYNRYRNIFKVLRVISI